MDVTLLRDSCHKRSHLNSFRIQFVGYRIVEHRNVEEEERMKRIIILVVVLVLIGGGYFAFQYYRDQQRAASLNELQTVATSRGNLTATVGATGSVRPNQSALLVFQTSGTVEDVSVEVGSTVEAGDTLVTLRGSSLPQNIILAQAELLSSQKALEDLLESRVRASETLQAVQNAEQALIEAERALVRFDEDEYKDELEGAREDIIDARDELRDAEEDFEPYEDWAEDNQTRRDFKESVDEAQREYDEALRRLRALQLEKSNAEAAFELAQATLQDARREYQRWQNGPDPDEVASLEARIAASQATLALSSLEAPFNGTVTMVDVLPGDQVSPGVTALRMDDLSHLLVDVRVSEVDINRILVGQPVNLTFDAILGRDYRGVVSDVSPVGQNTQGIVEFIATVELTDANGDVKPGMTAGVNIVVNQLENVVLVPNRAVRVQDGQRVVYVLRNGSLETVPISLGASSDTMSQVVDGNLQNGDSIVVNPPTTFSNTGGPPPFVRR
jgi:HlyD family secretion protein